MKRLLAVLSGVTIGVVSSVAAADVTLGPATEAHGAGNVSVVWQATNTTPEPIVLRSPGRADVTAMSSLTADIHTANFTGLEPGVEYTYELGGRESRFIAPPSTAQVARFAVFGDTRTGDDVHRQIISRVVEQRPDLYLTTGDSVASGQDMGQWRTFFEVERPLMSIAAMSGVRGNHDVGSVFQNLMKIGSATPGATATYGSLDFGAAHFVLVDSESDTSVDSPQYRFIQADLAANNTKPLFVVLHRPFYSSGQHGGIQNGGMTAALSPLFARNGVDVVFQGHDHHYERTQPINGVTYVVTGGGGAPLYTTGILASWTAVAESVNHFVMVDASATRIHMVATRLDGTQLDSVDIDPSANNGRYTGQEAVPNGGGKGCSVARVDSHLMRSATGTLAALAGMATVLRFRRRRRVAVATKLRGA